MPAHFEIVEGPAKGRKIDNWTVDKNNLLTTLQPSPVKSDAPEETLTLIPMGAARLRISSFPTIGNGPGAHDWPAPAASAHPGLRVSASHCNDSDDVDAMADGKVPSASNDKSVPRMTFWDHRGTAEWVQYDFKAPRKVSSVEVYWFDDTGSGQCRVPASWKVLYRDGDAWKPVDAAATPGVQRDAFNNVTFAPVTTPALRLEIQLQPRVSAGILEWKVND